jgi:ACS family D-galactonate transporter-like MFS transporter
MSTTTTPAREGRPAADGGGLSWIWRRQLSSYPETGPRSLYLAITVLATVVLYYELYIQGAVATQIITDFDFSFTGYVFVSVIGNLIGAFASLFAGLADRWGRANLVVYGLLVTGAIILFGLPHAPDKTTFTVLFALLSFVEGVVLVATPALIRDFSPQVGRGVAMGFWTLGPVLGSLVVTSVSSSTLDSHPDWRFQFYVCGVAGLVVFLIAFVGLRELSPALRDQLMVSMRDRALIEARAAGIDPENALRGHWRQMLRFDVVGSALAISLFLLLYYILVGFAVVYFSTVYGYSEARGNALANWYWVTNALALVITGVLTDRFRVRKPFMILGGLISISGSILFALAATDTSTDYYTLARYFVLSAAGGGMAYVAWMASFTETVERHNPAATATGLAIWGWTLRLVVTISLAVFTLVVPATSLLVDKGTRVQEIVDAHPEEVAVLSAIDAEASAALAEDQGDIDALSTALGDVAREQGAGEDEARAVSDAVLERAPQLGAVQALDPDVLATLQSGDLSVAPTAIEQIAAGTGVDEAEAGELLVSLAAPDVRADLDLILPYATTLQEANAALPADDLEYLSAHGAEVQEAQADNPGQWQTWWWVCIAGQVLFLPCAFVMTGRWSPRQARADEREHEEKVQRELAALGRQA